jgi:hypothetical protein
MADRIEFGDGFVLEGVHLKNDKGELLTEAEFKELLKKKKKELEQLEELDKDNQE